MGWLRTWWAWLAAGVAGLVAFFFIWRKDERTPYFDDTEDKRKSIEEDTLRLQEEVEEEYDQRKSVVEKEREDTKKAILLELDAETKEVKDDPKKVNDYLHDVDKKMR